MMGITVYWKKFCKKFRVKLPGQELDFMRLKQLLSEGREGRELEFSKKQLVKQLVNEEDSMAFTIEEMMEATQNFSQKIGKGYYGEVFFGKLPDGKGIAVKVLSPESGQSIKEFLSEIDLHSRVHHKSLVSLLGYCTDQSGRRMLIYNHISGGSLRDRLYGESSHLSKLNWKSRLKITIDAAEGLQYLHVCCTPMIIHRDVKTANILIDSDLNGKLCDLGISMMTMDRKARIGHSVKGSFGYLDPEYNLTHEFTQKSDVYGFGVVLLEIICGRPAVVLSPPTQEEEHIVEWVNGNVGINENHGKIVEIIDKKMDGKYDIKSIISVAKVALRCVEERASLRPSISEVVGELKQAFMYEKVLR